MSKIGIRALRLFILFGRNTIGCINSPYTTYRALAKDTVSSGQIIYILLAVIGYFTFASLVRTGIRNPYLLTVKFNTLVIGGTVGFVGIITLLALLGKLLGGKGQFRNLVILWSYTLIPTLVWFFVTSVFYLVLPPPRTLSPWGKLYSLIYISFSMAVLLWKFILYYLTLRFGLKFDLGRIGIVTVVLVPAVVFYSIIMYRYGIFRIPFI